MGQVDSRQYLNGMDVLTRELDEVRGQLVNSGMMASVLIGLPMVVALLYRARDIGWQNLLSVQIGVYLVVLAAFIFRHRLSFRFRALIFLSLTFLVGTGGLITLGIHGQGILILLTWIVLMAILFGRRIGLAALALVMVITTVEGLAVYFGFIHFKINPQVYAVALSSWLVATLCIGLLAGVMVVSLGRLHSYLLESISTLNKHMVDIRESNSQLLSEIAARKTIEASLAESEQRYRSLYDHHPDGVCSMDTQGRFVSVNEGVKKLTGHPAEELRDMTVFSLARPEDVPKMRACFEQALVGQPQTFELTGKKKNGRDFTFDMTIIPTMLYGSVVGVYGIIKDITDRKKAAEALLQEKERFKILTEESPFGVAIVAANGRYLYVNPKFVKMFGYTMDDVSTGRDWFHMAYPDPEYRKEAIYYWITECQVAKIGQVRPNMFTVTCKDKSQKTIRFLPVTMSNGDQFIIYEDLTDLIKAENDRKKVEEQLKHSQKMEAIGTLAGGIAHDFNNILAAIIGSVELAILEAPQDSGLKPKLNQVLKSSLRARELVRQILNFSRSGQSDFDPQEFAPIIEETLNLMRATLPSSVQIRYFFESRSMIVRCDPVQIQQILMNLCANSAYAMRGHQGLIDINLFTINLSPLEADQINPGLKPGSYCCLKLRDTGHGMDEETLERIFEPFFTTKGTGEGTGMGLSLVYGIVKSHRGAIKVYSETGSGSIFEVYLPLSDQTTTPPRDLGQMALPGGSERILLVDDEKAVAESVSEILEHLGYQVTTRTSSLEALAMFQDHPKEYDLVITDQTMPDMSGIELANVVMNIRADIPVILCTGFSQQVSAQLALEKGIRRFLVKPLALREMAMAVRAVLDGQGQT